MENDQEIIVPDDIALQASKATSSLLPGKSEAKYEKEYEKFCAWRNDRKVKGVNEDIILAYVSEKAKQYSASSLWSYHSMLKSTLLVHERVNIEKMVINRKIMVEKNSNINSAKITSNESNSTSVSCCGVVMGNTGDFELPVGGIFQNVNNCTFHINLDSKK